jgi:uncharacterized membrane protein YphA (DoxX/SURF4 family)
VASFTLHICLSRPEEWTSSSQVVLSVLAGSAALLLALGLWTPAVAALIAVLHAGYGISQSHFSWDVFLGGLIATALIALGPGASSVDARVYGRKRISVGPR